MQGFSTGRGTSRDKLERLAPNVRTHTPQSIRNFYMSNGFIENIVDGPAEDAVREWITIKTNRDNDDPDNGTEGLGISRLIINRMDELKVREKVRDIIRFSRMYQEGGFIYCGVIADKPQTFMELALPMPEIDYIDFINVFGPDYVSIIDSATNPLSKYYHRRKYYIAGTEIHDSRIWHMVRNYLPEERKGISVVATILDPIIAQDTALWSVSSLVYEMAVWVFKSPGMKTMSPDKLAETLANMKAVISTQSCMGIAEDEELQRITGTDAGKSILKEMFDFIMENLAGMAHMPKSRLMGQAQGTITSGQYDLRGYYEGIAKFQETEVRHLIYWIIELVLRERKGEIYETLGSDISTLDWEVEFNPLWSEDPKEQAERELKESQRDQIYINSAVLSPSEVKQMRFSELEEFDAWEDAPVNFNTGSIPDDEQTQPVDIEDLKQDFTEESLKNGSLWQRLKNRLFNG